MIHSAFRAAIADLVQHLETHRSSSRRLLSPQFISEANYTAFLRQPFRTQAASAIQKHVPFSKFNDTGVPGFAAIEDVYTALQDICPVYRALNKAADNGVDGWVYAFNHAPFCPWALGLTQKVLQLLGPMHSSEIPFVLGETKHLPVPNGTCDFTSTEKKLSEFMLHAWSNMAASQAPASESVWPRFAGCSGSQGLTFNLKPDAGPFEFTVCELFDRIWDAEIREASARDGAPNATTEASEGAIPLANVAAAWNRPAGLVRPRQSRAAHVDVGPGDSL